MKLFFTLLLLPCLLISQTQDELYYVIHVEGHVVYASTNELLEVNDRIPENARINYSTPNDFVVISKLNGKELCLKPNPVNKTSTGYWEKLSTKYLRSLTDLPSRGDNENRIPYLFFDKGALINPKRIKVFNIPKNENAYYYFKYCSNKKTKIEQVSIDKNYLLYIDNNTISFKNNEACNSKTFEIRYKTKADDKLELSFYLRDIKEIKEEISVLQYLYKKRNYTKETIIEKLEEYLDIIYGPDITIDDIDF